MTDEQKEFYIRLKGWSKIRAIEDDWWGNSQMEIGHWHSLDSAYELEMRICEQSY